MGKLGVNPQPMHASEQVAPTALELVVGSLEESRRDSDPECCPIHGPDEARPDARGFRWCLACRREQQAARRAGVPVKPGADLHGQPFGPWAPRFVGGRWLVRLPKHPLAEEGSVRLADAIAWSIHSGLIACQVCDDPHNWGPSGLRAMVVTDGHLLESHTIENMIVACRRCRNRYQLAAARQRRVALRAERSATGTG